MTARKDQFEQLLVQHRNAIQDAHGEWKRYHELRDIRDQAQAKFDTAKSALQRESMRNTLNTAILMLRGSERRANDAEKRVAESSAKLWAFASKEG